MHKRLMANDYDNIYTYVNNNDYFGAVTYIAKIYGITSHYAALIVSIYKDILNNKPTSNKNSEKHPGIIRAAKEYKIRVQCEACTPCNTVSNCTEINVTNHAQKISFRETLRNFAETKEAIKLFCENTQARNAFYDLLNALN